VTQKQKANLKPFFTIWGTGMRGKKHAQDTLDESLKLFQDINLSQNAFQNAQMNYQVAFYFFGARALVSD
jgi:hypothetical protein